MLDGTTLQLKGEVKGAYRGTAYGLTLDEKTQKIYVGGRDYINGSMPEPSRLSALSRLTRRSWPARKT